jgi:F-type H+-transporting ATPase subunit epsilon
MPMRVELVSPEAMVWSGEAEFVLCRTLEGELGILPGHAELLGVLGEYPVRIRRSAEDELVAAVHGGFLSVTKERVAILGERVERAEEIDVGRARAAYDRHKDAAADDETAQAALRRAAARLAAAGETV